MGVARSFNYSNNPNEIFPYPSDVIDATPDLRVLGKWMLNSSGEIAHWLGFKFNGKEIREPINAVIMVKELNPEHATKRLIDAMKLVGYTIQPGHSDG